MRAIVTEDALRSFRAKWTGRRVLRTVKEHGGRLLVNWPVGVGKSHNMDDLIEEAIHDDQYDLVVALVPTRQLIRERRWILDPPPDVKIVNLQPRPQEECGPDRNEQWRVHEMNGLGIIGRLKICKECPKRCECFWPDQYGKALQGAQVIYGTQAHLENFPGLIEQVQKWAKADKVLTLLDEVGFIMKSLRRRIKREDLDRFFNVLSQVSKRKKDSKQNEKWLNIIDLLLHAKNKDLRCDDWKMPSVSKRWTVEVQTLGSEMYEDNFRFVAYNLLEFACSAMNSREKLRDGSIRFSIVPALNCDCIIYSGTVDTKLLNLRLGEDFVSPFEGYKFRHIDTKWFNIASSTGTKTNFKRNSEQILDFFAQLVASRIKEGRRVLLIAKKDLVPFCKREMQRLLKEAGATDTKVLTVTKKKDLSAPNVIPIINYGMIGTNRFENFDCAYCLSGYYVNEDIVNAVLQDLLADDFHIPMKISTGGEPRRRTAAVVNFKDRYYDVSMLAQSALNQQEMDVVLQAVGRVRPYTKPREIITFQNAEHPQFPYTSEFSSITEARAYFRIKNQRQRGKTNTHECVQAAKQEGLSQSQVAQKLNLSVRTVKRHWH